MDTIYLLFYNIFRKIPFYNIIQNIKSYWSTYYRDYFKS